MLYVTVSTDGLYYRQGSKSKYELLQYRSTVSADGLDSQLCMVVVNWLCYGLSNE